MNHYIKTNEILKSLINVLKNNDEEYNSVFGNEGIEVRPILCVIGKSKNK